MSLSLTGSMAEVSDASSTSMSSSNCNRQKDTHNLLIRHRLSGDTHIQHGLGYQIHTFYCMQSLHCADNVNVTVKCMFREIKNYRHGTIRLLEAMSAHASFLVLTDLIVMLGWRQMSAHLTCHLHLAMYQ